MTRLLVLDFDGTMTDAEAEGGPFRDGYLEDLATLTGQSLDAVKVLATKFEAEVAAAPDDHGWLFDGHIVAPASVDPYLRIMPVARKIFDAAGLFPNETERNRLLDGILYKYNYSKTRIAFREGARAALHALEGTATYVVTNSHTDAVQKKIRALGAEADGSCSLEWLAARVHGQARKYVIDDGFTQVPATLVIEGLKRPVLLRRHLYFQALDALRASNGATWDDVTVVGDIFELDLSLPLSLGARVGLVVNAFTPDYEKRYVAASPRGKLITSLDQVPAFLGR